MGQATRETRNGDQPKLTIYYDGACPLCLREIGFYRRRKGADALAWVDVSEEADAAAGDRIAPDLSRCDALARFHVRDKDGRLRSGARAFAELWAALPTFRPFGVVARTPPIVWVLEGAYRAFLKIRPRIQSMVARRVAQP